MWHCQILIRSTYRQLTPYLIELDRQAIVNPHAAAKLVLAIAWICQQSDRNLLEKVDAMQADRGYEHLPDGLCT